LAADEADERVGSHPSRPVLQQEAHAAPSAVTEGRQQLGGISPTTFYALVKEGELGIVKIGRRSFVLAEEIDEFLRRKRYDLPG
jgi:excisionase family DNA binding protein